MTFTFPDLRLIFTYDADKKPRFIVTKSEALIRGAYWSCPIWYVLALMFDTMTTTEFKQFITKKYEKMTDEEKDIFDDQFVEEMDKFLTEISKEGYIIEK